MWRQILACVLIGSGILLVLFFRKYSGNLIPFPYLFYIGGLGLFISGFLLLRYTPAIEELSFQKRISEAIEDLKLNGDKISINLEQCELKEHNYSEDHDVSGSSNEMLGLVVEHYAPILGVIAHSTESNFEKVNVVQTVLIYNYYNNRTGETERFISRIIPKDKITLAFYLDNQKQTNLYVDKANRGRYYFDLDFLNI